MIDLLKYFKDNYEKNEYYKNHYFSIVHIEDIREKKYSYEYYDDQEVINAFKDIVKPENEKNITIELEEKFILICFYLDSQGYIIEQFPTLLKRPKAATDSDLHSFMYKQLRAYIINQSGGFQGVVTWDERRKLIDSLKFVKRKYNVSTDMDEIVMKISNEDKAFNELSDDSKLETICNVIEYLLKKNQKFDEIDCSKYFELISNDNVTKLRKTLQCYRHATEEDIKKREEIEENQKKFLIRYGIMVIETIIMD